SFAQQRLWLVDQLGQGSTQYNIPGAYELQGPLNVDAFKQALATLLERHEVLRTHFVSIDGEPRQVIATDYSLPFRHQSLLALDDEEQRKQVQVISDEEASRPFNLSADLMLRVHVLSLSENVHRVLYTVHHIASDGWSMPILHNELNTLYKAYSEQQGNPLPPLEVQYADYALWQRGWLQGEVLDKQLNYWQEQLAEMMPVHSLPLDKARPAQQTFQAKTHIKQIDSQTSQAIRGLCEEQGVTLFMFLETAFAVLLSRYSGESDIVIGTPIAGRTHHALEPLIGFFVNSLVLRTDVSNNPKFSELLQANKRVILDAYSHQHIPFEMLVETLQPERSLAYNPLFQIMFSMQNNDMGS
ncbi:condensation domain-containing protein, partial [Pseudoalteromonas holothuriae]|uniref:condensation domain-containing protein n=1 Tax=Pseudoalteromonas holothuriae TaxID=2963714 RepID=UPI0021C21D7B